MNKLELVYTTLHIKTKCHIKQLVNKKSQITVLVYKELIKHVVSWLVQIIIVSINQF